MDKPNYSNKNSDQKNKKKFHTAKNTNNHVVCKIIKTH